jgi:hypothetical protein
MRIATLNVWGTRRHWPARVAVLQQGFLALDADIVTLQETIPTANLDQAGEILGPSITKGRRRRSVAAARRLESLVAESPGTPSWPATRMPPTRPPA